LVAGINSTVILEPVASLAVRIVGPGAEAVTSALILWVAIQIVESIFLKVWIYFFVLGLVFFSVPFRLGRRLGTYLMSWSMLTAVALPLLPSLALSLEGTVGYETFLKNFLDIGSRLGTDPLAIPRLIASLPSALAGLIAAVIIALIVFPIAYLFMMSLVARSLAELLGGSSAGPSPAMMILTPSRQFAKELTG